MCAQNVTRMCKECGNNVCAWIVQEGMSKKCARDIGGMCRECTTDVERRCREWTTDGPYYKRYIATKGIGTKGIATKGIATKGIGYIRYCHKRYRLHKVSATKGIDFYFSPFFGPLPALSKELSHNGRPVCPKIRPLVNVAFSSAKCQTNDDDI